MHGKIVLLAILVASGYGVIHDQVTVRLCPEYFTVAHPPLFPTSSPTVLGICWGVAATFGVGLVLGVLLALVSQSPGTPRVSVAELLRKMLTLVTVVSLVAAVAGVVGFQLSRHAIVSIPPAFADLIPVGRHHRFMAAWYAHGASYLVGVGGAAAVIYGIWRQRGRPRVLTVFPSTKVGFLRAVVLLATAALIAWFRFGRP